MTKNCYDNRELSWLKFNERVLEEATDPTVPLCERMTFASIFQSNLDEFFMVRVGSIFDQMLLDPSIRENKTNMTCEEQLDRIFKRVKELIPRKDEAYKEIMHQLSSHGIEQVDFKSLSKKEEEYLREYFKKEISPLISPQIIDKRNPFPFFKNKDIYAVAYLESKSPESVRLGIIPSSGVYDRLIFLPRQENKVCFMLAEELILHYMDSVFENYSIIDKALIRVTRNADINADEALYDHDVDFRDAMSELLKKRKKLAPVRLEMSRHLSKPALMYLCGKFELLETQIFYMKTPLDLSFIFPLFNKIKETASDSPTLFFAPLSPQSSPDITDKEPMIAQVQKNDILLSYPYQSIKPFIRLLNNAAFDKNVVSVKITLYRVAKDSQIVDALIRCAENGKDVLVLVELRARFDEENNIGWSKRLEDAGCRVIYGLEGLKVHSKLLLITRKVNNKIEYITQIGTGNYNEKTSKLYTDLSLMTADPKIAAEANLVFNALSFGSCVEHTDYLLVAPKCLQNKIIAMIDEQITLAKSGQPAYIGAKMNSLTDKTLIDKLIEASAAGVKIDLIIRGISCLVAGVTGYTENITVTSIVGRFLEHSRIYIFGASDKKVYISSADFMTRNTTRRVEVAAPVLDTKIKEKILDIFKIMQRDNVKARCQQPDGTYKKKELSGVPLNSQEYFFRRAYEDAEKIITEDTEQKKQTLFEKLKAFFK